METASPVELEKCDADRDVSLRMGDDEKQHQTEYHRSGPEQGLYPMRKCLRKHDSVSR